ncbi:DUF6624 domain-containing protein [Bdellovibrio sp. HCB-162]|uniref:DUF6624 domain-containing protein n=1 Tax=Bdellovibrio sp. HCB-162 TaxID=3394234 RepID=UPI0039BCD358
MKSKFHFLIYIFVLITTNSACTTTYPRVEQDLKDYDHKIEKMNKDFSVTPENTDSIEWVKSKLDHMFEIDQYMRNYWSTPIEKDYSVDERNQFNQEFFKRNNKLDSQNTADTKMLLKKYEWFKISVFGEKADNQGWLLVQHADLDVEFQKQVLTILERLYPLQETKPANYAYLFDRVAISSNDPKNRKPQRYGTQGQCVGPGQWEPWPIEDEKNVDKRRKSMGLRTMAEYKALFKDICH